MEVSKEVHEALITGIDEGVSRNSALAAVAVPDEREAFEAWADARKEDSIYLPKFSDGTYINDDTHAAWKAWQARAALAATSAPLEKLRVNPESEPVAKYVYGEKTALLDVVALSLALESAKKQLAVSPVVLPEPDAWRYSDVRGHYRYRGESADFDKNYPSLKPQPLYTEPQVRAMLATGGQAQADARDARKSGCAESNRYCHARMCLDGDAEHEHDCPAGRAAIAAAKGE